MKGIVRWRPLARRDLIETFRYIARQSGLNTARQFLVQAQATFARLADMSSMGTPYEPEHPAFTGVRCFPLSRFKNYLVFYRPAADGIDIVRILHGVRDIPSILANDFGVTADDDNVDSDDN